MAAALSSKPLGSNAGERDIWAKDPVRFCAEALCITPQAWQAKALTLIAENDRLAIRSGHGVGKSALLAWLILWFLIARSPAKVPCTAPTGHQLSDILWGEVGKWRRHLREDLRPLIAIKSDRIDNKETPHECFAVARTARREQPEAFQGFHGENLLFIVDEASGVDDAIFEVGEGALSTPGAKAVLAGNPTRASGYFYDAFHRDRAAWAPLHVPCVESDRVAKNYAANMARRYGADSNIYRVRVLGEFPLSEDDAVIPLAWCESAVYRDVAPLEGFRVIWGVDVARFGADRTALAKRRGNALLAPVKSWRNKDTMQVVGLLQAEYDACSDDDRPGEILVDTIGIGAGVFDRLREVGLPARGINVGELPANDARYYRLRDELWWRAREWFEARDCVMPDDPALLAELSLPKYSFNSDGKVIVESKADMKKRSVSSPDLADAFCLTFAAGVERSARRLASPYDRRLRRLFGSWMSV